MIYVHVTPYGQSALTAYSRFTPTTRMYLLWK